MHVLAEVMKRHSDDVSVLSCVLQLQSQLAFEKQNILTIVQYGGIDGILDCIRANMQEKQLVIMCVQLLDNIFLGSQEYAAVALDQGCPDEFDKLQQAYADDEDVLPVIRSARLNLNVSSMHKKQENDMANNGLKAKAAKKKKAEIGKGQQARKLKMMSIRGDADDRDSNSLSAKPGGGLSGLREASAMGGGSKPRLNQMTSDRVLTDGANPLMRAIPTKSATKAAEPDSPAPAPAPAPEPELKAKAKKTTSKLAGLVTETPEPVRKASSKKGMFGWGKKKK